jgi:hypothetical protein
MCGMGSRVRGGDGSKDNILTTDMPGIGLANPVFPLLIKDLVRSFGNTTCAFPQQHKGMSESAAWPV